MPITRQITLSNEHNPLAPPLPWLSEQSAERLEICHDHRWLRIFGFPLIAIGTIVAIGLWLLPGVDRMEAGPMLAVGSLIGLAFVLFGAQLSFNRVTFIADKTENSLLRREGFWVFTRTRHYPLDQFASVDCQQVSDPGGIPGRYIVSLTSPDKSLRLAGFVESEPILIEARRWSAFLQLPLVVHFSDPFED